MWMNEAMPPPLPTTGNARLRIASTLSPPSANDVPTPYASSTSRTTSCAPSARRISSFCGDVVVPTTSWPASASSGTSCLPRTPDAPATKILIARSFRSVRALRRGRPDLCDMSQALVLSRLEAHANRGAVRRAEAAAVLDRLPDGQQRQRGRGHRPGGLPPHPPSGGRGDEGRLAEGVPVGRRDAPQHRPPQVGARPPRAVRRAVAARAAPHRLGAGRRCAGGDAWGSLTRSGCKSGESESATEFSDPTRPGRDRSWL